MCDTSVVDTGLCPFVETTRVDLHAHCGLWAIMTCQYRFINFNKRTLRWALSIVGKFVPVCEQGLYRNSLYLQLSSAVNLNCSKNTKFIK